MPLLHSLRSVGAKAAPIDSERDDWERLGRCNAPDKDAWCSDDLGVRLAAAHQCIAHCPVVARCHKEALGVPWRGVAVGGVVYGHDGPLDLEPQPCSACKPQIVRVPYINPLPTGPRAWLATCELCGVEFVAQRKTRMYCRTPGCERDRERERQRRARSTSPTDPRGTTNPEGQQTA